MALDLGPSEDLVEEVEKTLERSRRRVEKAENELEGLLGKIEKDPGHRKNVLKTVSHLIDLDRFDEAMRIADKCLETWKDDPEMLYKKGCALYGKGDYRKAMDIFEPLLALNPNSNNYKRAVNLSLEMMK